MPAIMSADRRGYRARTHGSIGMHDPLYATVGVIRIKRMAAARQESSAELFPESQRRDTGLISIYELLGKLLDKPGAPR